MAKTNQSFKIEKSLQHLGISKDNKGASSGPNFLQPGNLLTLIRQ
jgi:aldehyde dehydrogenase (NAD+)